MLNESLYRGNRFPIKIISDCAWHFCFGMSFSRRGKLWRHAGCSSARKRSTAGAISSANEFADALRSFRRHPFLSKAVAGDWTQPRVIITDKLPSDRRQHWHLNNRAENSHQPTRERERRCDDSNPLGTEALTTIDI